MNRVTQIAVLPLAVSGIFFVSTNLLLAQSESAKPEGTPEKVAGENVQNELDQLLEDAGKRQLTYSPDNRLLAHLDERLVTIWSVEERRQLHRFVLDGRPLAAAFSPDGGSLVTADGEGNLEYRSTIKLWSLATGEGRLIAQFLGVLTHFAFSPDGNHLAAASNLNVIGSITRNPGGGVAADRVQTGGSIHVWQVSSGDELLKVDIELPEYTAKTMQTKRDFADEPDSNRAKAAKDALVAAYEEAVRKRVPYRLNFSPDGQRLIGVSKSGQETIFDARTGKPLRPISRGEQDGDDQPATALELKSEGKEALGNGALAFETPESQEAEKQSEEVGRQPYMDELPDEVSAMAGLWRIDPDLDRLLEAPAENNRHPNSLRLSFAVPGAPVLRKETISLIEELFVKKMKHTIVAVGKWEAEKESKLAADRDSNCFVTTKNGATYLWLGTPDKMVFGSKVSQVWVSRRKQLLILDTNSMLPPRMRKSEKVRVYLSAAPNESAADPH